MSESSLKRTRSSNNDDDNGIESLLVQSFAVDVFHRFNLKELKQLEEHIRDRIKDLEEQKREAHKKRVQTALVEFTSSPHSKYASDFALLKFKRLGFPVRGPGSHRGVTFEVPSLRLMVGVQPSQVRCSGDWQYVACPNEFVAVNSDDGFLRGVLIYQNNAQKIQGTMDQLKVIPSHWVPFLRHLLQLSQAGKFE